MEADLDELKKEEAEILTLLYQAQGERFERLNEQVMAVRRKIAAIEPIFTLDRVIHEVFTKMRAGLDGDFVNGS